MKRRDLLAALAAAPLAATVGRLGASPRADATLLVVCLRGGYDAASLLVPTHGDFPHEARPTIGIARPGDGPDAAIALDADWGLHPALRDSMLPLYRAGELGFIPFAGDDTCCRHHGDAVRALGVHASAADGGPGMLHRLARLLGREVTDLHGGRPVSTSRFAADAPWLAASLRHGVDIGVVQVDGWDTHVDQGAATGYLADRFRELGTGLAHVRAHLAADWARTVVVVVSEFGRSVRENGNGGTEHGHGTVYWLLGGSIRGGRVLGGLQPEAGATLFAGRDLPVLNDRRDVFASLLARMYGLHAWQSAQVVGRTPSRRLDLA